jgi:8-oxo-dGTP pyrophosphatase MutT (NUDIX family)
MRYIKSCGVLLVRGRPPREFLLMKHPDRFDLPKGHIDPGETETECALREMAEETGIGRDDIQLDPGFRFTTTYYVRPARFGFARCEKTTVIFLGYLLRDVNVVTTEHQGFIWCPWNPPHIIQSQTIDPLLASLDAYLQK